MDDQKHFVPEEREHESLEAEAESLYSADLPYHNFQHALHAAENGKAIALRCKEEGLEIDEDIVYYALLFHDAGFHQNQQELGFATKEEYAAHLAKEALQRWGIDPESTGKVAEAIIATNRDASFLTVEQKVVRAADLAGLAGEYEEFLDSNRKLKSEFEMMNNTVISWKDWKEQTKKIVEFYLSQDIRLTKGYANAEGKSLFHIRTRMNLDRFLADESVEKE